MDGETVVQPLACLYNIIRLTEDVTGSRYCMSCDRLLPVNSFEKIKTKRFRCHACFKAARRTFSSSQIQKAYSVLICKARRDRLLFGYTSIALSTGDVHHILTPEQIKNYSDWSIVPRKPNAMLTKENAIAIRNFQRRLLVSQWKHEKDPALYEQSIQTLLLHAEETRNKTTLSAPPITL